MTACLPTDGDFALRQKASKSRRPSSQKTDMRVRMKSAWLSFAPSLLMRTKNIGDLLLADCGREFQGDKGIVAEAPEIIDCVRDLIALGLRQGAVGLQASKECIGESVHSRLRVPQNRDIRNELRVFFVRGVQNLELLVRGAEGNLDLFVGVILPHDGNALEHCVQGREPLLPVDDQQAWRFLFCASPDLVRRCVRCAVGPKQQIAYGEPSIERVEQVF